MSTKIPDNLHYTKEHEWVKADGDTFVVGITDHAQSQLGDVVYAELPAVGARITKDKTFGVVESVKAVSDLYAPLSGEVIETHSALVNAPEQINSDPYGSWMIRIKASNPAEIDELMVAKSYQEYLESSFK